MPRSRFVSLFRPGVATIAVVAALVLMPALVGAWPRVPLPEGSGGGDAGSAVDFPENVEIEIADFRFEPDEVTVAVGTAVTWTNAGPTDHTTTAFVDGEKFWDSEILSAGDGYTVVFTTAGAYEYVCALHPSMTATLTVTED